MLTNPQISAAALHPFCRSMSRMLEAGVEIRKTLKTSAARSSDSRLTVAIADVIQKVKGGNDLTSSFAMHEDRFPPLFLDLLNVGEQTGSLPEVFASLADYYEARVERMREFRSAIVWPAFQMFAAIMIVGLLIYLLGMLGTKNFDGTPMDVLGLGLVGSRGAITWFVLCFGGLGGCWVGYKLTRSLDRRPDDSGSVPARHSSDRQVYEGVCNRSFLVVLCTDAGSWNVNQAIH